MTSITTEGAVTRGIVTADSAPFAEMVAAAPASVRELAVRCRGLIFDVLPGTVEVVWPRQGSAGYGTGPRKMSDQFCWLAAASGHVVFGFTYGAELPDPERLLVGTGALMRHVKVRSVPDVDDPALRRLVTVATTHRVPPLPAVVAGDVDRVLASAGPDIGELAARTRELVRAVLPRTSSRPSTAPTSATGGPAATRA